MIHLGLKNKARKELNIDFVNITGAVMSQSEVILEVYADTNLKPQTGGRSATTIVCYFAVMQWLMKQ